MTFSPAVTVEIGFTLGSPGTGNYLLLDDAARGVLNTNTLAPDGVFTDVTQWVYELTIDRGARRVDGPVVRYEAGTCSITLDNSDRRFDPANLSGPYASGGLTQVTPMRTVRVRATYNGVTDALFSGFADAWNVTYQYPGYGEVVLTATDGFKVLAAYNGNAIAPVGAGETTGARVNRILDSAGWPSGDRVIATGDTTVQATTLASPAMTELYLTADTELGELYIDGAGRVVFRNRRAVITETRSTTSQGTFGDGGGSELEYVAAPVAYDDETIYNLIQIARVGGTEQDASDAGSQTKYLVHTFNRTDLVMETDAVAANYAGLLLFQSKEPELRFSQLTVNPQGDTTFENAAYPQVLGREIGDRITVIARPPGGGDTIQRDVFVRGIHHQIDARTYNWMTTWTLQSATKYDFLILDSATFGTLDAHALAY